jgi:hypothetical protein
LGHTAASAARTFDVDTQAPAPTLAEPPAVTGSTPDLSGTAGTAAGDSPTITVAVYPGSGVSGAAVRKLSVTRSGGDWSVGQADWTSPLADGAYTAQATQVDAAGNVGRSAARSFTVRAPAAPQDPPAAEQPPAQQAPSAQDTAPSPRTAADQKSKGGSAPAVDLAPIALGSLPLRGLTMSIVLANPASVRIEVLLGDASARRAGRAAARVIATKRLAGFSGGQVTVKLPVTIAKRLSRLRSVLLTIRVTASPASGSPLVTTRTLTLRR